MGRPYFFDSRNVTTDAPCVLTAAPEPRPATFRFVVRYETYRTSVEIGREAWKLTRMASSFPVAWPSFPREQVPNTLRANNFPYAKIFRHAAHRDSAGERTGSQRANVILARQLPHASRQLQFKQRRKHLRRRQLRVQQFENFIDLQRRIGP
jgi:hypothetical protein